MTESDKKQKKWDEKQIKQRKEEDDRRGDITFFSKPFFKIYLSLAHNNFQHLGVDFSLLWRPKRLLTLISRIQQLVQTLMDIESCISMHDCDLWVYFNYIFSIPTTGLWILFNLVASVSLKLAEFWYIHKMHFSYYTSKFESSYITIKWGRWTN